MKPLTLSRPSAGSRGSSEHTPGHRHCPACESVRRAMIEPDELARKPFREAAEIWLDAHRRQIGPGSVRDYVNCIKALEKFFSDLTLSEIHIGHFEQYQKMRREGTGNFLVITKAGERVPHPAGPSRVNHDLNTLSQILRRAGLWTGILKDYYKPLRLPRPGTLGRVMTEEQEKHLFEVANTREGWKTAYLCALLSVNTTADGSEIRTLRLMDCHPDAIEQLFPYGYISINDLGTKNEYRQRRIPLNITANFALRALLERARKKGAIKPEHFLLPHRAHEAGPKGYLHRQSENWDPTRPMHGWRKAWNHLRAAAGMPWLHFKHLRHHVITKLLENPAISERTVKDLAGQISDRILDYYAQIRQKPKVEAVLALEVMGTSADARQERIEFQKEEAKKKPAAPATGGARKESVQ